MPGPWLGSLGGAGGTGDFLADGSIPITGALSSSKADGAGAYSWDLSTSGAISAGGLFVLRNNGTEKFSIGNTGEPNIGTQILAEGTTADVATKNQTTTYLYDSIGAYLIYQPTYWNGSSYAAAANYGIGHKALQNNSGINSSGVGKFALRNNAGGNCNGFGHQALINNIGANSNGIGYLALSENAGANSNGFGFQSLEHNTGANSNGFGLYALRYNQNDNNTALGYNAWAGFLDDTSGNKTFAYTDINAGTDRITVTSHGFGATNAYVNIKYTQGTSSITGLTSGNIYQVKIIDANTLGLNEDGRGTDITDAGTGTGHTFTPQYDYTNTTVVGASAVPSASNQVVLGNASVTQVLANGIMDVTSNKVRIRTSKTPASAAAAGNTGDLCWDSSYIYVCVATDTWKRAAIATW